MKQKTGTFSTRFASISSSSRFGLEPRMLRHAWVGGRCGAHPGVLDEVEEVVGDEEDEVAGR
jgi:hypothetical protein